MNHIDWQGRKNYYESGDKIQLEPHPIMIRSKTEYRVFVKSYIIRVQKRIIHRLRTNVFKQTILIINIV